MTVTILLIALLIVVLFLVLYFYVWREDKKRLKYSLVLTAIYSGTLIICAYMSYKDNKDACGNTKLPSVLIGSKCYIEVPPETLVPYDTEIIKK